MVIRSRSKLKTGLRSKAMRRFAPSETGRITHPRTAVRQARSAFMLQRYRAVRSVFGIEAKMAQSRRMLPEQALARKARVGEGESGRTLKVVSNAGMAPGGGGGKRAQKAILAAMAAMVATSSSISINGIRMNCSRTSSLKVLRAADPASREIADAAERGGKAEHRMSHAVQDAGAPQEGLGDRRAWQVSRVIRVKQGKTG